MFNSSQIPTDIRLSLDRIEAVLQALGNPQKRLPPVVHVAGTNGKGSTLAFLEAILVGEGASVHLYTSPHLIRINERIKIHGKEITDEQLSAYLDKLRKAAGPLQLSYFEELTAASFLAFSDYKADFCLVEVGLGGRLDATNLVNPAVCALTSISYDHQEYLGSTIQEIAHEKAGIIKKGVSVVCAQQRFWEAKEVIAAQAMRLNCDLFTPAPIPLEVPLGLKGTHQYDNAATAIRIAELLLNKPAHQLYRHLKNAYWPGRLQKLFTSFDIWVDGAHNVDGIIVLAEEVKQWKLQGRPLILAVSQLSNRSEEILMPLLRLADEVYHIEMDQGNRFRSRAPHMQDSIPVKEALPYFMQPKYNNARILFTGSLYMVGEVLKLREMFNDSFK
ncbi:bifunctional folylpolyglutamate synthase/dihydrofolate synthase [Candidatus Odyssella thessalonicensis]|uniref:bifunctional folylpolyglutamate synthase/dihydrofolate synthase n=1 Tax=Candidatus Odyssella thessalonicensis TaxID=84647 RepID=UPI000225B90C|nr:folylpolyglutamate synthase/dihydrofolate synthase family protein [Candidatus Odyssella thessalonicensis]